MASMEEVNEIIDLVKEFPRNRARCKWAWRGEISGKVFCRYYGGRNNRTCLVGACPLLDKLEKLKRRVS